MTRKGEIDPAVDSIQEAADAVGPYVIYAAGGIFTHHDLATNVFIKEAVWKWSDGKFQLDLPQTKELRDLDRPDLAAHIRNVDLLHVFKADMVIARFDGLELDAGTMVEFMLAKSLGKPTLILRCDSRRLGGQSLDEPYNLMAKNWPRTVEIQFDSLMKYVGFFADERQAMGSDDTFQATMNAELQTIQKGLDDLAKKIIDGLEMTLKMKSPFPPEYQEVVYKGLRYTPGAGFDQLLTEKGLSVIIQRLRENGTL